jgi:transcriptional regulator with XRE-family HTH domain
MRLDSECDFGRAAVAVFDVANEPFALEAEGFGEGFLGQAQVLSIVDDPHKSVRSHMPNEKAIGHVRTCPADFRARFPHNANMARRGIPAGPSIWYLREWMAAKGMKGRGAQAKMMKLTDWSKATMSQLYNGQQDFSPKILKEAADALGIEPHELLMLPDRAMALRRLRADALRIVADTDPAPTATGTHG